MLSGDSICYCAGVGLDVSFDMAVIEKFGCEVFAFDPTPKAIDYVESNVRDVPGFHFIDVGLWSSDETLKFFAPANENHVSHSVVNLQNTSDYFEANCKRLSSIMHELGHERLDLLKLDIEGAEYAVIDSILDDNIPVKVLCVEYDQPTSPARIWRSVKQLEGAGFDLVSIDSWNYTFVQSARAG
jgi:FkbM family methyltransferase